MPMQVCESQIKNSVLIRTLTMLLFVDEDLTKTPEQLQLVESADLSGPAAHDPSLEQ